MILGHLALLVAALFTGAALYICIAEQPARLGLPAPAALDEWRAAERGGGAMRAGLSFAGFALGLAAFLQAGNWQWLAGGVLMLATWPFTHIGITPTSARLRAARAQAADEETHRLMANWGQLHMVRTGLGAVASFVFLCAAVA